MLGGCHAFYLGCHVFYFYFYFVLRTKIFNKKVRKPINKK